MKFEVKYNRYWLEIIRIYDEIAPYFLGDIAELNFPIDESKAKRIFDLIYPDENILLNFVDQNKITDSKCKALMELIPLDEKRWDQAAEFLKEFAPKLEKRLNEISPGLSEHILTFFGLTTPANVKVMLGFSDESDFIRGSQISDFPLIGLQTARQKDVDSHVRVVVHEILHYMIKSSNLREKFKRFKNPRMSEEALLQFFASRGVLTEKLNLGIKFDVESIKYSRCNEEIQYFKPFMHEYLSRPINKTVIKFLEDKKVL